MTTDRSARGMVLRWLAALVDHLVEVRPTDPAQHRIIATAYSLVKHANPDGTHADVGQDRIANETGQWVGRVNECLAWLRDEGWFVITGRGANGRHRRTLCIPENSAEGNAATVQNSGERNAETVQNSAQDSAQNSAQDSGERNGPTVPSGLDREGKAGRPEGREMARARDDTAGDGGGSPAPDGSEGDGYFQPPLPGSPAFLLLAKISSLVPGERPQVGGPARGRAVGRRRLDG